MDLKGLGIVAVAFAVAALGGCTGGTSATAPHAPSPDSVRALRLIHSSSSDRLRASRPADLPAGTRIYREKLALIRSDDEQALVPISDVRWVSGGVVTARIGGVQKTLAHATVTYTDEARETYVKPGIDIPRNLQALEPFEVIP